MNISKREKIILGVVAGAAVVAAYIQFLAPSGGEGGIDIQKVKQDLTSFVTSTSAAVAQAKPDEQALHALALAARPWKGDPFLKTDEPIDLGKTEEINFPELSYTGFVGMDTKRVAVINGVEYEVGDELSSPGFILEEIHPDRVIVGVKGEQHRTTVPLVEEVF